MIIIIRVQKCWNVKDGWCECKAEIISTVKIIPAFLLKQFERGHSGLSFAHSLYSVLFLICFKMATDLLENFHIFLVENRFFSKFKILTLKIIPAIPLPRFKRGPSGLSFAYSVYGVLFLLCLKMATDLLENFQAKIYMWLYCWLH